MSLVKLDNNIYSVESQVTVQVRKEMLEAIVRGNRTYIDESFRGFRSRNLIEIALRGGNVQC